MDSRTSPSTVKVHLKRSKCDQFGRGVDVIVGRTDTRICPVAAMVSYTALRQDQSRPFFINSHGVAVTKSWLVQQVRTILAGLGLPQGEYAGHSFRNRGSHIRGPGRCGGFNYPGPGEMAELSLSAIYTDAPGAAGHHLK